MADDTKPNPHPNPATPTKSPAAKSDEAQAPAHDPLLVKVLEQLADRTQPTGPASATPGMDVGVPGGVFIVNAVRVNCNGRQVDEKGAVLHPEDLRPDPATGRMI